MTAVLRPDAADGKKYILFLRPRDPRREAWEGAARRARRGGRGVRRRRGVSDWRTSTRRCPSFDRNTYTLERLPRRTPTALYLSDGGDTEWAEKFRDELRPAAVARPRRPGDARRRARPSSTRCGSIKDEEDIRFLRRAAEMSAQGHIRAMQAAAPGKYEFEVQQALDGYCAGNGARRMAYPSIAGSGPELLHPPLRPEQPADEGRRGAPERLRRRVRDVRDRHHADVSRQRPLLDRSSARSTTSCWPPRRRRWPSSSRASPHDEIEKAAALGAAPRVW